MARQTLNVFIRGTRDYVQGSQILGRTAELVGNEPPAVLVSAKFTKITERGVVAVFDGEAPGDLVELGRAQFATEAGRQTVQFFEVAGDKAPPIDDVPRVTANLETDGKGTGSATFVITGTFESYLVAIIEFVKAVHAQRGDRVTDIWFTALMGARLPLGAAYPQTGTLRLTPKIERMVDGRLQTLSLVDTEGDGNAPPQFQICFSCVVEHD
jgi:hypothetical protein